MSEPCGPAAAPRYDADGLRLAIAAHPFAGGGTVLFDDRRHELRPAPSATFAPSTAAAAGLQAGELIDLVAGERTLRDLLVRVDRDALEGAVSVIDGLPAAPANAFAEGEAVAVGNVHVPQAALVGGTV